MSSSPAPSKSQVKKAGSNLRKYFRGELEDYDKVIDAVGVVLDYRAAHATPLVSANNGLRSMLRTCKCPVEVSQRLKRMPTILDKLRREPTLSLANMQDIGGVRAILDNIDQVRRIEAHIKRRRTVTGYSDYIKDPRSSGYRGVHVIVEYGREDRQIEVQLRTRLMHEWAITVERLSNRANQNFKQDGNTDVQRLMAAISEAMAIEEQGGEPPVELQRRIVELSALAEPSLSGTR